MNVYDFDGTIYNGDSSIDFWLFCLKKKKSLVLYLPFQCIAFVLYCLRVIDKNGLKSAFFSFFKGIHCVNDFVVLFWNENKNKIANWYQEVKKPDDCVISASPEFLLREICSRLNVSNLIATDVDELTGKLKGENCYANQKVVMWKQIFPKENPDCFYSDSKSDVPMALLAKKAFFVQKNVIRDWIF